MLGRLLRLLCVFIEFTLLSCRVFRVYNGCFLCVAVYV